MVNNPEAEYAMMNQHIIQCTTIVKSAFVTDADMEDAGAGKKEAQASTNNSKLFDPANIVFSQTSLWVHTKLHSLTYDGHQVLSAIHEN